MPRRRERRSSRSFLLRVVQRTTNCTVYNGVVSTVGSAGRRGAGQRAGLSRAAVLAAARRVADAQGVDRLTMRRLAGELGVMPNTLYSYFPTKEALLDGVLDDLLGDIDPGDPAEDDWQDGVVRVMDSSRRLLLAHPRLASVFLTRPTLGPNAARLGEVTFALLRRGGLEGDRAVAAFPRPADLLPRVRRLPGAAAAGRLPGADTGGAGDLRGPGRGRLS